MKVFCIYFLIDLFLTICFSYYDESGVMIGGRFRTIDDRFSALARSTRSAGLLSKNKGLR